MKELQSDPSIVILPVGKWRSTVIPNREDYLEKCMDHRNNGSYQLLKNDSTTKIEAKTLKRLKALKDNEFIGNKYFFLKSTAPIINRKHTIREGVLIRPIVSYSGSPLYSFNGYITNILKNYVKDNSNKVKYSTTFFNCIRNVSNEDYEIMISIDVDSLYTNIPTTIMLNIIKGNLNNDDQFISNRLYLKTSF